MVKKATSLMLLLSCLLLAVLGCSHSQEPKILGKWVCKMTDDRIELLKDHTCTVDSMGLHYPGKWTLSGSSIKVEAGQIVLNGSFDGNNIEVVEAIMHSKYTFEKVVKPK
jgi:hypothetical protein